MTIPHLDDEALSAALDDEGSAEEMQHLAGCRQCQTGVARLAAAARAVAAPVPPRSESDVTAAIQQVLGSQEAEASGIPGIPPRPMPTPTQPPMPIGGGSRPPDRTRTEPRRWVMATAGIAAAVMVAAAVVGLSRSSSPSSRLTTSATAAAPSAAFGGAASTGPAADRTDLGDQSDPAALARTLKGLLSRSTAAQASPPSPDAAKASPGAAATPAPTNPVAPCADQARAAAGATGAPALVASVRWQAQPAVVLVYNRPAAQVAVVMRTADCSLLALVPL